MILPDSISSKEIEFEKMLSINVEVLDILVGRSIWDNKKWELSLSRKLLIESFLKVHILINQYLSHLTRSFFWKTLFVVLIVMGK